MVDRVLGQYKKVWILGASTGIGAELVKQLVSDEREIYLSARSADKLNQLAAQLTTPSDSALLVPLPLDITDQQQTQDAATMIGKHLDLVIVNAGICEYMDSDSLDLECARRVMETNFFGALNVINAALPLLRVSKQSGRQVKLAVMSSSVSYQALPRAHAYGASKSALRYFIECLKIDLQKEGIDVQIISPGFVETPLTAVNDFPMPGILSVEQAVQRIISGLATQRGDIHFPKRFTWSLKALSLVPEGLRYKLLSKLSRHSANNLGIEKGAIQK